MDITKFPKSKELFKKETIEALNLFISSFPVGTGFDKEFITEDVIEKTQQATLENNPRHLFDFFDKQNIFLNIEGKEKSWDWIIGGASGIGFESRIEAENEGFESAFKILEEKL